MKKFFIPVLAISFLIASCETASTTKQAEQDSIDAVDITVPDTVSNVDTTLSSIGDSLKADFDKVTGKIKQESKEFGDAAKATANKGVEKIKEGAQKIKDAAKASVDAAKDELKK